MDKVIHQLKIVKSASKNLQALDDTVRQSVLLTLADLLRQSVVQIIVENTKDLQSMDKNDPKFDRLLLTGQLIQDMASDVERIASLEQPVGKILEERTLPNGLQLEKIAVPLGVVAVIYESRPNVTIDVFSLCFKVGNACVLKGGKEANHSNRYLVSLIKQTLKNHGLDTNLVYLLPYDREAMQELLQAQGLIDVCIPRGSQALIDFVRLHAKIPVIETGAGIVHTYFDKSGDLQKGRSIIENAKTRRVSVCNALDTLVIHEQRLNDLTYLIQPLARKGVELFADEVSFQILQSNYPKQLLHKAKPEDFGTEFLSYKMSIKTVSSEQEALNHIRQYSSGHSEAIIVEDKQAIDYFLKNVDAAAVYANASTAFTDGGQFGMGAEIGISTQKLHARGPMGLRALTSYKWLIYGNGQIRK